MGYQLRTRIVYILKLSTASPIILCTIHLYVSQRTEVGIIPDNFLQNKGMGSRLRIESVYISSINNQPLTSLHLYVSQHIELWFVPYENFRETRVWEITLARIW